MDRSVRQNKLAAVLQSIIGRFLAIEAQSWGVRAVVVVDRVLVNPDLKNADVWLSFSPYNEKTVEREFGLVQKHLRDIQNFVFEQMALRRVPRLHLFASDTTQLFKIMDIFDTIKDHDSDLPGDKNQTDNSQEDSLGDSQ